MRSIPPNLATWSEIARSLLLFTEDYICHEGKLIPGHNSSERHMFFSRAFLSDKRWSVFPLWEGDIRCLILDDETRVPLTNAISQQSIIRGAEFVYYAGFDRAPWPYQPGAVAQTLACREFAPTESLDSLFELTAQGAPHWGDNFVWPSSVDLVVYTNGDNAAFLAGRKCEVQDMLKVSWEYCINRFVRVNRTFLNGSSVLDAYLELCREYSSQP
jgi:hypothetical protein